MNDSLPEPEILAQEIVETMHAGLISFKEVLRALEKGE